MKKKQALIIVVVLLGILVMVFAVWKCRVFLNDHSPLYLPGRDTVEYWKGGTCQIVGRRKHNELILNGVEITSLGEDVTAYRTIDNSVFFQTTAGRIVVDLETETYETYRFSEPIDVKYAVVFSDLDSFVWLSIDE